jgi:hypothetical protein
VNPYHDPNPLFEYDKLNRVTFLESKIGKKFYTFEPLQINPDDDLATNSNEAELTQDMATAGIVDQMIRDKFHSKMEPLVQSDLRIDDSEIQQFT